MVGAWLSAIFQGVGLASTVSVPELLQLRTISSCWLEQNQMCWEVFAIRSLGALHGPRRDQLQLVLPVAQRLGSWSWCLEDLQAAVGSTPECSARGPGLPM